MISTSQLRAKLREFILENFLFSQDPHPLQDSASLMESGFMDSMGVLELLDYLNQHFQVAVDSHEMSPQNLDSVDNLVKFVSHKLNSRTTTAANLLETSL